MIYIYMYEIYIYIFLYNGTILSHKKEWNLHICKNIDGPRGYYAKCNKSQREKQILHDFSYMWKIKNKTNGQIIKLKLTHDTENKLVIVREAHRSVGCGDKWNRWGRLRGTTSHYKINVTGMQYIARVNDMVITYCMVTDGNLLHWSFCNV